MPPINQTIQTGRKQTKLITTHCFKCKAKCERKQTYDFFAPYTPTRMKLKYSSIVKWILLSCFTFPWKFPKDNFTLRRSVRRKKLVLGVAKKISHWLLVQPLAAINDYLASINFGQRACVSVLRIISRSILKWRNFLNVEIFRFNYRFKVFFIPAFAVSLHAIVCSFALPCCSY